MSMRTCSKSASLQEWAVGPRHKTAAELHAGRSKAIGLTGQVS